MNRWKMTASSVLALSIALQGGAVFAAEQTQTSSPASVNAVYAQFEKEVANPATLVQSIAYLNSHIQEVSAQQAAVMVLHLENAQTAAISKLEKRIFPAAVQKQIDAAWRAKGGSYAGLLSVIKDSTTRKVLTDARDMGFKLATSEGMYYPVLDYTQLYKYASFVTPDIRDYLGLMANETLMPPMNDAALVIPWSQALERVLKQEAFILKYKGSNRLSKVQQLYQQYRISIFYGANNTPLFDYETNQINDKALQAYTDALASKDVNASPFLMKLSMFVKLVNDQEGVKTKDVEAYLKKYVAM